MPHLLSALPAPETAVLEDQSLKDQPIALLPLQEEQLSALPKEEWRPVPTPAQEVLEDISLLLDNSTEVVPLEEGDSPVPARWSDRYG